LDGIRGGWFVAVLAPSVVCVRERGWSGGAFRDIGRELERLLNAGWEEFRNEGLKGGRGFYRGIAR
jgi:hypothetical protein